MPGERHEVKDMWLRVGMSTGPFQRLFFSSFPFGLYLAGLDSNERNAGTLSGLLNAVFIESLASRRWTKNEDGLD